MVIIIIGVIFCTTVLFTVVLSGSSWRGVVVRFKILGGSGCRRWLLVAGSFYGTTGGFKGSEKVRVKGRHAAVAAVP